MLWQEILSKGGPIVLILFAYSVVALTLVFERLFYFAWIGRPPAGDFEEQLNRELTAPNGTDILAGRRGPEARVVRGILAATEEKIGDLARVAWRLGSEELQRMERGFRTLAVLGNTAPLLGLLGTIIGMIKAFMVIEQAGGKVDAQALAGGIWEALLTTGVGLAVAIPVLLLLHLLEGMADRRARTMHVYASLVLEKISPGGGASSPLSAEAKRQEGKDVF